MPNPSIAPDARCSGCDLFVFPRECEQITETLEVPGIGTIVAGKIIHRLRDGSACGPVEPYVR